MIAVTLIDVLLWSVIGFFSCLGVGIVCLGWYFVNHPYKRKSDG